MLESIKSILDIKDSLQDDVINTLIEIVQQRIQNYCSISVMPTELENVVVDIVVNRLSKENGVKSVKTGDTTITYTDDIGSELDPYKSDLNRFRKVCW